MRKRVVCLLLVVAMMFSMSACTDLVGKAIFLFFIATGDDRADKADIFEFVREHEEDLLKAVEAGDLSAFENQGPIRDIYTDNAVVDFYCGSSGISVSGCEVGFLCVPDDDMTAGGDAFVWRGKYGSTNFNTEHICGNFYYYELYF